MSVCTCNGANVCLTCLIREIIGRELGNEGVKRLDEVYRLAGQASLWPVVSIPSCWTDEPCLLEQAMKMNPEGGTFGIACSCRKCAATCTTTSTKVTTGDGTIYVIPSRGYVPYTFTGAADQPEVKPEPKPEPEDDEPTCSAG